MPAWDGSAASAAHEDLARRLVIIAPGIPHESRGASTVLFYHYIAGFKRAGFRIMNVLLLQPDNSTESGLAEYERQMADHERFAVVPCRADSFVVSTRFGFRLDTGAVAAALEEAEGFRPDAVVCFDLLSAWVGAQIGSGAKVAWLGDLRFQTEWYHTWYGIKEGWRNLRNLPAAWVRCHLWKRVYRDVLRNMESVIVSANGSREALHRIGIQARYLSYPWPDVVVGADDPVVDPAGMPTFLFLGTLTGLGSRSAFHFMLEAVYPEAVRVWGRNEFRILIAGARGLPSWVERELGDRRELEYLGFVDDIGRTMRTCHAVLVPIKVPVGNRSRILTAMAAGVPVVAHENAALGNPDLVDGVTCYLARDGRRFVEGMRRAVEQPEEAAQIARKARARYEAHFAPEAATAMLLAEVERVIAERQRA
ncbi:MAG: glycosyltransferase [Candidatus Methylomirabilis sp.]